MSCKRLDITPDLQVWVCHIPDEAYGLAPSPEEMRQECLEYEMECDRSHEQELADQFVEGLDYCPPWPIYADLPFEVEEPQVFGP